MGQNKYIGARYVPKILRDDEPWDKTKEYEALTVVFHQGNSFTSRQYVPANIDILNKDYWACTGNYDAQVEIYRQETQKAVQTVNNKLDGFSNTQDGKFQQMLNNYKTQINNYAEGKYNDINEQIEQTNDNLTSVQNDINTKMQKANEDLQDTVEGYTQSVNNQLQQIENIIASIDIVYDEGTSTDVEDENFTIIEGNGGIA